MIGKRAIWNLLLALFIVYMTWMAVRACNQMILPV
jgi:hypothetical protein